MFFLKSFPSLKARSGYLVEIYGMAGVCPKNVQHPNSQASPEYQMHQPTKLPNTKSLNVDNVDNNNDDDDDPKPP